MSDPTINEVERLGIIAAHFVHRLANDMTCIGGSASLLDSDLHSGSDPAESLENLKASVTQMEETLELFTRIRRRLNPPATLISTGSVIATLQEVSVVQGDWIVPSWSGPEIALRIPETWLRHILITVLGLGSGTLSLEMRNPGARNQALRLQVQLSAPTIDLKDKTILEIENPSLGLCREMLRQLRGRIEIVPPATVNIDFPCETIPAAGPT